MSGGFRKRIEGLLTGAGNALGDREERDDDDDEGLWEEGDDEEDVVKSYVVQRLLHEGFTMKHVKKAYREAVGPHSDSDEQMDKAYELTLQYLCIHLKEDELPIGFDPRGGTLDVISNATATTADQKKQKKNSESEKAAVRYDDNIVRFARYFGLDPKEAFTILSSDKTPSSDTNELNDIKHRALFWRVLCDAVKLPLEKTCAGSNTTLPNDDGDRNEEAAANECEALKAIFDSEELTIKDLGIDTIVMIDLPFGGEGEAKLSLLVQYANGLYPDLLPMVFIINKDWNKGKVLPKGYNGGNLHLQMVKYLSEMSPGQECIFELFGHVQSLLQEEEDSSVSTVSSLMSHLCLANSKGIEPNHVNQENTKQQPKPTQQSNTVNKTKSTPSATQPRRRQPPKQLRRPRNKSSFWNTNPNKTPPAISFPKTSSLLDRARKSLPAAKARDEFLSLMGKANGGGRVILVTGETVRRSWYFLKNNLSMPA